MIDVPESVAVRAKARMEQNAEQRRAIFAALASAEPLNAETEEPRKLKRIQAAAGVSVDQARALSLYQDRALYGLDGDAKDAAERLQGNTVDFMSVAFLELAQAAARSVARVVDRTTGRAIASGFMVGEGVFLTNHHVIGTAESASDVLLEFNYEQDITGRPKPVTQFELEPARLFVVSPDEDLDFAIVAVGRPVLGTAALASFGVCPLLDSDDKHVMGEFVNIIQHPNGTYKQIVLRENRLVTRTGLVLHYEADTMPGSSGSPVFNDQWEVVALHHWGEPYRETRDEYGRPVSKDLNEGLRISAIVTDLRKRLGGLTASARELLDRVLSPVGREPRQLERAPSVRAQAPNGRRASTGVGPQKIVGGATREDGEGSGQAGDGQRTRLVSTSSSGELVWSLPVEIGVTLRAGREPRLELPKPRTTDGQTDAAEKIEPDPDYSNRSGYNARFLHGFRIPLPTLRSKVLSDLRAPLLAPRPGADPYELKYQHFSIVMRKDRRMAFFTGVNIDGGKWLAVDRKSGESGGAEAREKWFDDPRISPQHVWTDALYAHQDPRTFDRGHLVRRQDPCWGTPARARRANADTFHLTNCTPQHYTYNESARWWQGIENYVLDNALADEERVCVFTGPIFKDDDPEYRNARIPAAFWKIVVRVSDGELCATGLVADQSSLLPAQLPERRAEAWDRMSAQVRSFQRTIADIEDLTGLDFGQAVRDSDTFAGAEARAMARELASFGDISLRPSERRVKAATTREAGSLVPSSSSGPVDEEAVASPRATTDDALR